jgi:hypothetical protein
MVLAKKFWDGCFVGRATFLNPIAVDTLNSVTKSFADEKLGSGSEWALSSAVPDSDLKWKTTTDKSMSWDWRWHTERDGNRLYSYASDTNVAANVGVAKNAITMAAKHHVYRENTTMTETGRVHNGKGGR